ncbi:MAG: DUF4468 domain-containing protein [Janthinobacterium lividum]
MKTAILLCSGLLPLAALAQRPVATEPPLTYHVGLTKAPLYHSLADTLRRPSFLLPSQAEALVVGRYSARWVVVRREGFLYFLPVQKLSDYDPEDANPLPIDSQTQLITYQGVVEVPGISQADLYARANAWIAQTYTPADALVEGQPAAGQLVVKGARRAAGYTTYQGVLRSSYAGVVRHTLTIYVKDGRYKYILTNLTHDAAGTPNMQSGGPLEQPKASLHGYAGLGSQKPWADLKLEATRDARHLANSLQAAMTQRPVQKAAKKPSDF